MEQLTHSKLGKEYVMTIYCHPAYLTYVQSTCVCAKLLQLCPTLCLWMVTCQLPLSMGFSMQEYWSGLPCSSPGGLPDPGSELGSPALQADSLLSEPLGKQFMQRTSWEMLDSINHELESRFLGEISTTSDMQMIPLKWQKVKRN